MFHFIEMFDLPEMLDLHVEVLDLLKVLCLFEMPDLLEVLFLLENLCVLELRCMTFADCRPQTADCRLQTVDRIDKEILLTVTSSSTALTSTFYSNLLLQIVMKDWKRVMVRFSELLHSDYFHYDLK